MLALGLWVAVLGTGFTILSRYKSTPGDVGAPPPRQWPTESRIARSRDRATLVMFAHPHCPCTRASIHELAQLMARLPHQASAYVLFLRPRDVPAGWEATDLWASAAAIPGTTVLRDDDGIEAERFHALTSGLTVVYDRQGRLLFRGGITASRGHEGDSFGRQRIISLLATDTADRTDSPVFGCALGHSDRAQTESGESRRPPWPYSPSWPDWPTARRPARRPSSGRRGGRRRHRRRRDTIRSASRCPTAASAI